MSVTEIGCCGAYCKTCPEYKINCKGCKTGYAEGERDINRARCRIKICCFREKKQETCADCSDYSSCQMIQDWQKKGYKYNKYGQAIAYIRERGYKKFMEKADGWSRPYGKLS